MEKRKEENTEKSSGVIDELAEKLDEVMLAAGPARINAEDGAVLVIIGDKNKTCTISAGSPFPLSRALSNAFLKDRALATLTRISRDLAENFLKKRKENAQAEEAQS